MLAIFIILGFLGVYAEAATDPCHTREIELCMATMMISASDGIPATDEEIDRSCEPIQEGFECIGNYSKECFTPLMMEVYEMAATEPRESQMKFCTRGSDERAEYLKHAPCLQNALSSDKVKPDVDDMLAALEAAIKAKFNERITIMCCGSHRLFKATSEKVQAECGSEALNDGSAIMGLSLSRITGMFCRGFETGSPKCKGILPPPGTPTEGMKSQNQLIRFISTAMDSFS